MLMLVNCSNCHTPLELPHGATSIRCAVCRAVTLVADPMGAPLAPPAPYHQYQPPPPPPPSPYNYAPPGQLTAVHGRKRAVICGISYRNTRQELKGCINDAKCMKYLLINRFKFPADSILMLTGKSLKVLQCSADFVAMPQNPLVILYPSVFQFACKSSLFITEFNSFAVKI